MDSDVNICAPGKTNTESTEESQRDTGKANSVCLRVPLVIYVFVFRG